MPNWCMNELTITGPADKVSAWAELHTTKYETSTSVLDFNKSVPQELDEEGNGNVNWQYNNWGTKWGACDTSYLDFKEGHVTIAFDTACVLLAIYMQDQKVGSMYNAAVMNWKTMTTTSWVPKPVMSVRTGSRTVLVSKLPTVY